MTTKIIDRRCTAAPTIDAEADAERLRRRAAVREAAARRDIELGPATLAEADVKASESRCEALADQHAMTCRPWQDELAKLESTAIERIGRREPANTEEDSRRAELTKLVASATTDLETSIAAERELQATLRRKARKIREGHPPADTILMQLAKPPLASPRLLAESFVARERVKWLKAREQAAEKSLKIQTYNATEIAAGRMSGDAHSVRRKVEAWQAELSAVGTELAGAMKTADAVHKEILDE